jgi:hypothetical protein
MHLLVSSTYYVYLLYIRIQFYVTVAMEFFTLSQEVWLRGSTDLLEQPAQS